MLTLFEIQLPQRDNAGRFTTLALKAFEQEALTVAGGFSRCAPIEGAWRDGAEGKDYYDTMIPYRIACTRLQFTRLRGAAFRLFPDQIAIMVAEIGTAEIIMRDKPLQVRERVTA